MILAFSAQEYLVQRYSIKISLSLHNCNVDAIWLKDNVAAFAEQIIPSGLANR